MLLLSKNDLSQLKGCQKKGQPLVMERELKENKKDSKGNDIVTKVTASVQAVTTPGWNVNYLIRVTYDRMNVHWTQNFTSTEELEKFTGGY